MPDENHKENLLASLRIIAKMAAKSPDISYIYIKQANNFITAYLRDREGCKKNSTVGEAQRVKLIREYLEMIEYAKRK